MISVVGLWEISVLLDCYFRGQISYPVEGCESDAIVQLIGDFVHYGWPAMSTVTLESYLPLGLAVRCSVRVLRVGLFVVVA